MQLGQSRTLPVEKPELIDLAQAARYFGARGEADTATMALLQRCAVPLLAAATPRAVWLRAEVKALAEAGILRGSDVMRHLEGCGQAILLAVTLGPGVDAQIRRAGVGDIAAGVASDALGSALAEQTADAAEAELRQLAAREEKYLTGRFSPGYGDWDIAVQPLVAAALDTVRGWRKLPVFASGLFCAWVCFYIVSIEQHLAWLLDEPRYALRIAAAVVLAVLTVWWAVRSIRRGEAA